MKRLAVWLATAAGVGYAPIAPGTAGSAVGVIIYLLTARWSVTNQAVLAGLITLVGIWASRAAIGHFGKPDPGPVVIDEVAGQLITFTATGVGPAGAVAGFVLFRVFDIVKPWPADRLERLHGGLGIMADDVMAAVYGCAILHLALWLVPGMR